LKKKKKKKKKVNSIQSIFKALCYRFGDALGYLEPQLKTYIDERR
jgi:hypothetical protein